MPIINLKVIALDKKDRYILPGISGIALFLFESKSTTCPYGMTDRIRDAVGSACGLSSGDIRITSAVVALFSYFKVGIYQNHHSVHAYYTTLQPMSEELLNKKLCFMSKFLSSIASQDPDYFSPEMHSEEDAFSALKEFTTALKKEGYNFFEK